MGKQRSGFFYAKSWVSCRIDFQMFISENMIVFYALVTVTKKSTLKKTLQAVLDILLLLLVLVMSYSTFNYGHKEVR